MYLLGVVGTSKRFLAQKCEIVPVLNFASSTDVRGYAGDGTLARLSQMHDATKSSSNRF